MELSDLDIHVRGGNQLSLKGKREAPTVKNGAWHRQERDYGAFTRAIDLPQPVSAEKVRAELKHGVLCVTLPKHEGAKPRRIKVKS